MSELWPEALSLLRRAGFGTVVRTIALGGGANNRVIRADTEQGPVVVKEYFRHAGDPWDRMQTEWSFSTLAWRLGIRAIAEPLEADPGSGIALYAYVEGRSLEPADVGSRAVGQALTFFRDLNRHRTEAADLQSGAEACFSIADHLATIDGRVRNLCAIQTAQPVDEEARDFVTHELAPAWAEIRSQIERSSTGDRNAPLDLNLRCISPSDFGFHNALALPDGTLRFVDFEYAGWDDPAKVVGDFFNQVALPVPLSFYDEFVAGVADAVHDDKGAIAARSGLLLPAYGIKWCCILLNEFAPLGDRRRRYAGANSVDRKRQQLRKAREHFGRATAARL